ncbi:MAG: hypothetical protein G8345_19005 [Magnetococcales bacterium]|nr:hypothetical protein [Magnetococcales bacterium]
MTVRRVDNRPTITTGKSRRVQDAGGENFASYMSHISGVDSLDAVDVVDNVPSATDEPSKRHRREQLEQTKELLDSLEALEQDLTGVESRQRLRESRDQALRTLSESPRQGEERDLLQRTALLATVELAKSERGDYS